MKSHSNYRPVEAKQHVPAGREFGNYGIEDVAYVKTVQIDGKQMHAIHAADGTPLTVLTGRDLAFATVRQHELEPLSVH